MNFVASVLSAKLSRTGRKAGAFFVSSAALLLVPAIAAAVTGPGANDPAIVTGQGVAGTSSYWYPDPVRGQIEIGSTWLGRPWWGTGTNAEAKRLMLAHAFDVLGFAKVAFRTDPANARSQRALERLGARRDGLVRRDWPRPDGTWRASVHYSILRAEWPAAP